jgi:CRP-like cAMP-binding protein
MLEEHRAALSAIQCVSQDFRGFTESQLDELLPFLDFIDFSEGQEIVTQGEDASWFGLLLGGQLEVRHGSHVLATLTPGRIVGEIAFFRGGKRGASMIGISAGTVAAVQFGSMPRLFEKSATTATTLVRAMGRAAVRKMEQIQEIIPRTSEAVLRLAMAVGSFRGGAGAGHSPPRHRADRRALRCGLQEDRLPRCGHLRIPV